QMCDFQQGILAPQIQGTAVIRAFDRVGSEWKQLPPVEFNQAVRTERAIVDQSLLPSSIKTAVLPAYSLALAGTWLALGTAGDSSRGFYRGSVHVFRRSADTWTERYVIENDEGADGDLFGFAVALSEGLLVVGAPGEDVRGLDAAAV